MDQVGPQLFGVDILVAVERLLELRYRKTLLRAGQPCDHVAGEQLFVCIAHFGIAAQCLSFVHVRILFLSTGTLEDEQVESHESRPFETQRLRSVRHRVGQVGTRPVQYRHEVVGDAVNAAPGKVADALLVVVDVALEIARLRFDVLVYRHAPGEPGVGYLFFALCDLFDRPYLPVGDVVQRCNHVGHTCLADVGEAYRIIGSVPAPRLFA